jgi:predicted TIM-barrel fold metal-dependent hydrolase
MRYAISKEAVMLRFENRVRKLLEGSIDVHIHSAPDIFPRILNDVELALMAKQEGMRAVLVKSHVVITADRAEIASQQADFPVFGAIALNLPVGGLNLEAVEVALKLGAKEVWMPTIHAKHFSAQKDHVPTLATAVKADVAGLYLLNKDGSLKEELYPIFKKIAEYDVALGTGHITKQEAMTVVKEAAKAGIKKIILTHPLATFVNYSVDDMKQALKHGVTFIEHCFNDVTRQVAFPITQKTIADTIRAIGAKHTIMSTDSGQWLNPVPVQQMGIYIKDMLDLGISEDDIRTMVSTNPARMLGL